MSPLTQAMIINAVVLFAVLEADLGPHRKIGRFRIVRPLLMSAAIVPLYLTALTTHGAGLTLEIAGAVAGLLLGLLATLLMKVYRSPRTGKPASRAGSATPRSGSPSSALGPHSPTVQPTGSARSSAPG